MPLFTAVTVSVPLRMSRSSLQVMPLLRYPQISSEPLPRMSTSSSEKRAAPSSFSSTVSFCVPETSRFCVPSASTRSKFFACSTRMAAPERQVTEAPSSVRRTSPLTSPVLTTMQPSSSVPLTLYSPGEAIVTTLPLTETPPPEAFAPLPLSVMTLTPAGSMPPEAEAAGAEALPLSAEGAAGAGPIAMSPQPVSAPRHSAQRRRSTSPFFITAYPCRTRVRR